MLFFDSKFYCSSAMTKAVSKEMKLVTVAVSSGDTSSSAVNKSELSFSTSNWNSVQTVIGVDDEIDNTLDRNLNLTHAGSGGDYASVSKNLAVTVTDDEDTSSLSVGDARADEGDTDTASLQFTVNLSPAADHQVTEDWATSKETADTSKTVTVTSDQVDERHETLTVTLSNASGAALGDTTATGTITDDDTRGIVLTPDTVTVTDTGGGRTADYKVKLTTQPIAVVAVNKTSLSFSTSNWNTEQTGNGADDAIDNTPDRSLNMTQAASDGDYGSVSKDLPVTKNNILIININNNK